ncbi:BnaA10g09160D [Brassica napus]|uniref:BnaA10g09160D protein n=1 Tax=Brassica napus TaxID=3708 RepID=A0A078FX14_BRANA|nr:BnaA10g09160D [Brassica napus]
MAQKLELIRGGGGSIKIGATGTVATLMTRELDSMKQPSPQTPTTRPVRTTIPVSVDCGTSSSTPRRPKARKSSDEASSSNVRTPKGHNARGTHQLPNFASDNARTPKGHNAKSTHQLPMLGSDNVSLQGTPRREKRMNIVDIVDVKCGNPDRAWANPITSRLKKLGFSKLNESIG